MANNLKLKVKKAKMVRKIDGVKKEGFYGRVITNGTKPWDIDTSSDKDVKVTINSSILGVRQGDMLIQFNGDRMHISCIPVEWYEERFIYDDED